MLKLGLRWWIGRIPGNIYSSFEPTTTFHFLFADTTVDSLFFPSIRSWNDQLIQTVFWASGRTGYQVYPALGRYITMRWSGTSQGWVSIQWSWVMIPLREVEISKAMVWRGGIYCGKAFVKCKFWTSIRILPGGWWTNVCQHAQTLLTSNITNYVTCPLCATVLETKVHLFEIVDMAGSMAE